MNEVQELNKNLKEKNKEMKRDLVKVQGMNEKLLKELNEQKKANDKMKEAISRIEQKLAITEKPQQRQPKSRQITRPTINTQTTLKPTSSQENCKLKIGNVCYFVILDEDHLINYYKAVEHCKKRNADVGLIRDEESYDAIMKFLKRNLPKKESWIDIWTGNHFDPITPDVTPANSFFKENLSTGIEFKDWTNIYLSVRTNTNDRYEGLWNTKPSWLFDGVLCEILT
uniref:uncharacterized protein LOC120329994 n=1 Tax=Styela clava TaxID=7725 RepID=UPI0019394ECD|nr:uncharacterized protein LOC120329994 [Styela clava]